MLLLTVDGPKVPLSRGLLGFVALRCYAEECAFSLITQARRRGDIVAAYGRAAHPLGDRGGLCIMQHGLYNWEKPGLHSFLSAV